MQIINLLLTNTQNQRKVIKNPNIINSNNHQYTNILNSSSMSDKCSFSGPGKKIKKIKKKLNKKKNNSNKIFNENKINFSEITKPSKIPNSSSNVENKIVFLKKNINALTKLSYKKNKSNAIKSIDLNKYSFSQLPPPPPPPPSPYSVSLHDLMKFYPNISDSSSQKISPGSGLFNIQKENSTPNLSQSSNLKLINLSDNNSGNIPSPYTHDLMKSSKVENNPSSGVYPDVSDSSSSQKISPSSGLFSGKNETNLKKSDSNSNV